MTHPITFVVCAVGLVLAVVLAVMGHWQSALSGVAIVGGGVVYGLRGPSYKEEADRNTEAAKSSAVARWRGR